MYLLVDAVVEVQSHKEAPSISCDEVKASYKTLVTFTTETTDNDKRNVPTYVIYGSDTYPVDTSNPENIIAQRVQGTEYTYAPIRLWTAKKYFAVTAVDRCGNESEACKQVLH